MVAVLLAVSLFSGAVAAVSSPPTRGEWAAARAKAIAAVAKLSTHDKVALASGIGFNNGPCTGNTAPVTTINHPGLCLNDGPLGLRGGGNVSVFPAGINAAATFNRDLIRRRGAALGHEFRGKGAHVLLGPMMNMMRSPEAGRNWEGFGGDPYLSGEAAYETIVGIQSTGVQAVAKHALNNEQEHQRDQSTSQVDDRTNHELYLHPFLRSVQAGVSAIMCSYNQLNGTYTCEHDQLLNGYLKGQLNFTGYVMSDWFATHSTSKAANTGLDPGDLLLPLTGFYGPKLEAAVALGTVSQDRINELATRILTPWYLLGQDSGYPAVNYDVRDASAGSHVDVRADHASLIREIGSASTVLLKNSRNMLPLSISVQSIGIVGSGAGPSSQGLNKCTMQECDSGVLAVGWGSGSADFTYLVTPLDAITAKAQGSQINSSLSDTDLDAARRAAAGKAVALVFITADSGEWLGIVEGNNGDRNDLNAWHGGDALVNAVASVNNNTVVVVNAVGPIILEKWIDNPNVTALIWSGLPGQEAGNAVTDILFGDVNPSGRLPYTIGKSRGDYAADIVYLPNDGLFTRVDYTEALNIDYRHFDASNIEPRFPFGFGLSYTNFTYSDLSISGQISGSTPPGNGSSVDPALHQKTVSVQFTLRNTGSVNGTEIPQLYLSLPANTNSPVRVLKGFDAISLAAGESNTVTLGLSRYDLSTWDVTSQTWKAAGGVTKVVVGSHSRDARLTGSITV